MLESSDLNVIVTWGDVLAIKAESMAYKDFFQYIEHHKAPQQNLNTMLDYANWCANRPFKVFIYPLESVPWWMFLALKALLWVGIKTGNISNRVIIKNPKEAGCHG